MKIMRVKQQDGTLVDIPIGPGIPGYTPIKGIDYFDGTNGVDGVTPVKGVDYYTEADKNEFYEYIASELAKRGQLKPEFANSIDELNEKGDTTKLYVLPDGFIYAYLYTETIVEPTNAIPTATDTDRKTIYNGIGYKKETRINSSGAVVDASGNSIDVTGFIPVTEGDTLEIRNLGRGGTYTAYVAAYNSSNTSTGKVPTTGSTSPYYGLKDFDVPMDSATFGTGFNAVRISGIITADTSIIVRSANSGGTVTEYKWTSTGHAFVPADYEQRIVDLESGFIELGEDVVTLLEDNVNIKEDITILKNQGAPQSLLFVDNADELNDSSDKNSLYVLSDGEVYDYLPSSDVVFENELPTATSTYNGTEVYGEKGYVVGVRLSSDGSVTSDNGESMLATGFIKAPEGEYLDGKTIETEGFKGSSKMKTYVNTYDSNGNLIKNYTWTGGSISKFKLDSANFGTGIASIRISASSVGSTLPTSVTAGRVKNDSDGGYAWQSTGFSFVKTRKSGVNGLSVSEVFAPSPQLPADGSETADFNGDRDYITAEQIYAKIDELLNLYPRFITKEVMGKDASGTHDWCRYVCSKRFYDAWQKPNYPPMYAWVNGSTTIYSQSVSPRIGDTLYTTAYIGTAKGTVTAVSNANQTRTVGGVVYTRDKSKDVEPTLVYTETAYSPYFSSNYSSLKKDIYDNTKSKISTISSMSNGSLTGANGITYTRYPFGDRNSKFEEIPAIVIAGNEHGTGGDPATPAMISARIIKDLCECKNMNNPFLNLLKNEYMMVFCPVVNPWGLHKDNKSYSNANSVNIDRNFDTVGWWPEVNEKQKWTSGDYGGSENETQYFMNTLVASKCKVAMCNHSYGHGIDNTTGEAVSGGICSYMFGEDWSKYDASLLEIAEVMASNYNLVFKSNDANGVPALPNQWAKTRSYFASVDINGVALEMNSRDGFITDPNNEAQGKQFTPRVMEAAYTQLLQVLYMLIDKQD